jgi:hypothetical protein
VSQHKFSKERMPSLIAEMEAILVDLDAMGAHLAGVHLARALDVLKARLDEEPSVPE